MSKNGRLAKKTVGLHSLEGFDRMGVLFEKTLFAGGAGR
jgi:hypothetical protein